MQGTVVIGSVIEFVVVVVNAGSVLPVVSFVCVSYVDISFVGVSLAVSKVFGSSVAVEKHL